MVRHNPRLVWFDGFLSWLCQIPSPLADLHRCCVCVTALWEILLHRLCRSLAEGPQGCCSFIPPDCSLAEAEFGIVIHLPFKLQLKETVMSGWFQNFQADSLMFYHKVLLFSTDLEKSTMRKGLSLLLFFTLLIAHTILREGWDQGSASISTNTVLGTAFAVFSICFRRDQEVLWIFVWALSDFPLSLPV